MRAASFKVNLFAILFYITALILILTGKVDVWVVALIVLSQIEVNVVF